MDKLKMHTPNLAQENIDKLVELFPTVATERLDDDGNAVLAIDFGLLRQELSDFVVDGQQERYQLDWPGKRAALFAANAPIAKTLRPVREESVDFDTTKNLFIEGDNLDALKLLQESYLGKVKLIYIDPPYNTGNDFIYADDFAATKADYLQKSGQTNPGGERLVANADTNGRFHSDWLSMMLPRLRLARQLLTENGVLVSSIDDFELPRLLQLCDEVFGPKNHVETLVWKRRYGGGAKERHFASIHEYLVIYARDISSLEELFVDLSKEQIERYYKLTDENAATRGPYRLQPLEPAASMGDRPNLNFPIIAPDGSEVWPKRQWLWSRDRVESAAANGELDFKQAGKKWQVSIKQYLQDETGVRRKTKATSLVEGLYGQAGSAELKSLFDGTEIFPYPKPSALIQFLVSIFAPGPSLVMDFFAGSGSTAHGVLAQCALDRQRRQFILVQLPETCEPESAAAKARFSTISKLAMERIRRAGQRIADEAGLATGALDIGFRVVRVDTTNMADVLRTPGSLEQSQLEFQADSVKTERTHEDIVFQVMLDWGLDITADILCEVVEGNSIFVVADGVLIACFEDRVQPAVVRTIAEREPLRAVFLDSSFATDADRINAEQMFAELSPSTDVKVI